MTVNDLAQSLLLRPLAMPEPDREIRGCYAGDLLSWVMGRAQEGDVWVTIMTNINVIAVASLCDVACVILAEDVTVEEDVLAAASAKGINLLSDPRSTFGLCNVIGAELREETL